MKPRFFIVFIAFLLLALGMSACFPRLSPTVSEGDQAATQDAFIRDAVQSTATTMAMLTEISKLQTQIAQPGGGQAQPATATLPSTSVSGATTEATFTPVPSNTPTNAPTSTPEPTNTPVPPTNTPVPPTPTFTVTPIPCNSAHFVSDVTIPDGTTVSPGTTFTKTWRLKNDGACTWTTSYDVVFVSGTQMSSSAIVDMQGNVTSGQVIDISVTMTAPTTPGKYRSNWKLRDASGVLFGVGQTSVPFYADIKVVESQSNAPLDFVGRMCEAEWTSGAGTLHCPGTDGDARGFVLRVNNPTLESGYVDDEPVLVTNPQMITDGIIRGKYPAFKVATGHHFVTIIGCAFKATNCDVNFQLDYQIGTGSIQTLKTWHEVYDEKFSQVDVDLSSLAGKDVKFILTVFANGSSNQDRAQWLAPSIIKK
jgi:hypothetical protein